jgi:diamine N-acetyltransferase
MQLILKEVTAENWQQVVALRMPQAHRDLVPPNAYSLAESRFVPDRIPLAVYDGETLIGFVVVSYNETIGRGWIHRFMIDQRFVNKGYSRKTIKMVIRRMRRLPGCQLIGVDYRPKNTILEQFYEGLHFRKTGQTTADGDVIAILRVRPEQPEAERALSETARDVQQPRRHDTLALTAQDDLSDALDLSEESERNWRPPASDEPSEDHSVSVTRR